MKRYDPLFNEEELDVLFENKKRIKTNQFYDLIKQNNIEDFDPLYEAFSILDPKNTGELDIGRVNDLLSTTGISRHLAYKEIELMLDSLDIFNNGKINFKNIKATMKYLEDQFQSNKGLK